MCVEGGGIYMYVQVFPVARGQCLNASGAGIAGGCELPYIGFGLGIKFLSLEE